MKRFSRFINEAKLSQSQRDKLDDLILNVHMTTHPEYDGDEEPTKYLNMIRKEFGDKVAKQVSDGIEKVHWGRDNQSGGHDKLAWRKGGARITKSGKMNAQDVKALKNRIKRDKAWGGITKAVKLPEEVELDEGILKPYHAIAKKPWSQTVKDSKGTAGEYSQIAKGKDFTVWTGYSGSLKKQAHYVVRDDKIIGSGWAMNSALKDAGLKDKDLTARSKFAAGSILNKGIKESVDLDEKYKDPWAAPRKGSSAWHAAQQRKKAERDPEEVKRVNAIGNKNHMVGTAKITHNEAVEVSHDRYMRSHGKRASGGEGSWMFTHKRMGDANVNDPKEVHSARGKFSDAKKSAQQWAKKHGHSTVYVMEEVQLDEIDNNTIAAAIRLKMQQDAEKKYRDSKLKKKASNSKTPQNKMAGKFDQETIAGLSRLKMAQDAEKKYRNSKLKKEEVELDESFASNMNKAAKKAHTDAAEKIKKMGPVTRDTLADINAKLGNTTKKEEVELDEVSDKKLDAYRQKAFADQPAGDDGSDKYRKRKFGRDLAFAKQTGRAKVLATKEEVEPDEDDYDKGEYDYEGEMTKTQLRTLADAALELHDMLEDDENLPEWIQSKITKAADYVDSARDYMISQWAADEDEEEED